MEFARLAHSFEKLGKTSSRLALIAILAELFRSIDSTDEIAKVCYLVQGRVAPFFEALEIAQRLGLSHVDASSGLAQVLPQVIDKLTPEGQVPVDHGDIVARARALLEQMHAG